MQATAALGGGYLAGGCGGGYSCACWWWCMGPSGWAGEVQAWLVGRVKRSKKVSSPNPFCQPSGAPGPFETSCSGAAGARGRTSQDAAPVAVHWAHRALDLVVCSPTTATGECLKTCG